jgi:hypothetical protein
MAWFNDPSFPPHLQGKLLSLEHYNTWMHRVSTLAGAESVAAAVALSSRWNKQLYVILDEKYVECLNSLSIQHVFMSYADEKYDVLPKKLRYDIKICHIEKIAKF